MCFLNNPYEKEAYIWMDWNDFDVIKNKVLFSKDGTKN